MITEETRAAIRKRAEAYAFKHPKGEFIWHLVTTSYIAGETYAAERLESFYKGYDQLSEFNRTLEGRCKAYAEEVERLKYQNEMDRHLEGLEIKRLKIEREQFKKLASELLELLGYAKEHLEYCGYGDAWERSAVETLPNELEAIIAKAKDNLK